MMTFRQESKQTLERENIEWHYSTGTITDRSEEDKCVSVRGFEVAIISYLIVRLGLECWRGRGCLSVDGKDACVTIGDEKMKNVSTQMWLAVARRKHTARQRLSPEDTSVVHK